MVLVDPYTMARAKMSSPLDMLETSCTRLVRRMVNLPRAISRAVDQGHRRRKEKQQPISSPKCSPLPPPLPSTGSLHFQ
ncbi:hypothetical protein L1987_53605 [Smallanthus sonchifolius]|uniref:Uncharacterized protein n=1 Tax=Smallanthus sonchifolius TaxID=185202 RepID=A0ACB9EW34_9ASTR|nr:hypothetical protein L1987_53605 [Smallanthus sonchifolius]